MLPQKKMDHGVFALTLLGAGTSVIGLLGGSIPAILGGAFVLLLARGFHKLDQTLFRRSVKRAVAAQQHLVFPCAERNGGRLTASVVTAQLGWPIALSEQVLQSLDDGYRVASVVNDEGFVVYEFRELLTHLPREVALPAGGGAGTPRDRLV